MEKNTYDVAIASLSEAQELVILSDDVYSRLGKVECERNLGGTEIVDCKQDLIG
jgi:hypothetical protein